VFKDCGFDCLGAEESTKDKAISVLKKEGPGLLSSVLDASTGKGKGGDSPTPDQMASKGGKKGKDFGGGLSTGAKIGIGVGAGAAALLGGVLIWKLT
jgi:hypothetical protein